MDRSSYTRRKKNSIVNEKELVNILSSDDDDSLIILSNQTRVKQSNCKKKVRNDLITISSDSNLSSNDSLVDDVNLNIHSVPSDGEISDVNVGNTTQWNDVESPRKWTNSMRRYYNKPCKRQRYFNWKNILKDIRSDSTSYWRISDSDIYPIARKTRRCLICRQTDHLSYKCPRKKGICSICGVPGHLFFKCPQRKCLNCGIQTSDFIKGCVKCVCERNAKCVGCNRYGHEFKNCPDLWRRFHCTVAFKDINSSSTKLNKNIQCCNCAKVGHLYEECTERYWTTYVPTSVIVSNYEGNPPDNLDCSSFGSSSINFHQRSNLKREANCELTPQHLKKKRKFHRYHEDSLNNTNRNREPSYRPNKKKNKRKRKNRSESNLH